MAEGFKVADAFADFHIDVDTAVANAAARLKTKAGAFDGMGREAGKAYGRGFRSGLDLEKHADDQLRLVGRRSNQFARIGNTAGESYGRGFKSGVNLRAPMSEQIGVVKSARGVFGMEGKQAGQAYARGFGGTKLGGLTVGGGGNAEAAGEEMATGAARGFSRGGQKVQREAEKVAARANATFSALKFTALSAGLPAAAAVGAAGAGAALAAVPLAVIAASGIILAQNKQVHESFSVLGDVAVQELTGAAQVMAGPLVSAGNKLTVTVARLRPQMDSLFAETVPMVDDLADAVSNAAMDAFPGLVTMVKASKAPMDGLNSLIRNSAIGFTEFATNVSRGAQGAGQGIMVFGHMIRDAEGFLGTFLANMASQSAGPLTAFQGLLRQAYGTLENLTASGSGAIGFLSGFTSATSGMVGILRVASGLLSVLPAEVTQFGGSFAATAMLANAFGLNVGSAFDKMREKVSAATTPAEKFKGTMSGLGSAAIHPAMLAVTALALGLGALGQAHADAAANADLQRGRVQSLADALRASNGAIDANVRSSAAARLQDFELADGKRNLLEDVRKLTGAGGISQLTDAYLGNQEAGASLVTQLRAIADAHTTVDTSSGSTVTSMDETGKSAAQLADIIGSQAGTFQSAVQANQDLASATTGTNSQLSAQAAAANAAKQAIYDLAVAQLGAADKTFAYATAQTQLRAAHENAAKAAKENKEGSLELTQARQSEEGAMLNLIRAAGEMAAANYRNNDAIDEGANKLEKSRLTMMASGTEAFRLAGVYGNNLPASVRQYITSLDASQLAALGVTRTVNGLGQAVYALPGGKTITIASNAADQTNQMQALRDKINAIPTSKKTVVEIVTIYKTVGTAAVRTGAGAPDVYHYGPHSAAGGPLDKAPIRRFAGGGAMHRQFAALDIRGGGKVRGPGTRTSDSILTYASGGLAGLSNEEYVIKAAEAGPAEPFLDFINGGGLRKYLGRTYPGKNAQSAAREALDQLLSGGQFFEDFSFHGASANLNRYNDELTKQFYASRGPGWNFDNTERTRNEIVGWLKGYLGDTAAPAKQQPVTINVYAQPEQDVYTLAAVVSRQIELARRAA
jgi:hypothetical protein